MAIYVLLGPPGGGKGTLAELLRKRFGFLHISTGDILREEIRRETPLGRQVRDCMGRGALVPDEVVGAVVAARLAEDELRRHGCFLDGFPRTLVQAQLFERLLADAGLALDRVFLLATDDVDRLIKRLTGRRVCGQCRAVCNLVYSPPRQPGRCDHCGGPLEQRGDDTEPTARERLRVYTEQTEPLVRFYDERGLLLRLDGAREGLELLSEVSLALGLN